MTRQDKPGFSGIARALRTVGTGRHALHHGLTRLVDLHRLRVELLQSCGKARVRAAPHHGNLPVLVHSIVPTTEEAGSSTTEPAARRSAA